MAQIWVGQLVFGGKCRAAELPLAAPNSQPSTPLEQAPGLQTSDRENVLFVTSRRPTGSTAPDNQFGPERGETSYGVAQLAVAVDPHHRLAVKAETRHVRELSRSELMELLRRSLPASGKVIVVVHGYNTTFNDAVVAAARLKRRIESNAPIVIFSWPSKGGLFGFARYIHDVDEIDFAMPFLKRTLLDILRLESVQLQLVVHSVGARAAVPALKRILHSEDRALLRSVKNIVLAAPDIEQDVVTRDLLPVLDFSKARTTLYVSNQDVAMWTSERLHGNPRAGSTSLNLYLRKQLETIDISFVDQTRFGHSGIFESARIANDLDYLLNHGVAGRRHGLVEQSSQSGQWWVMRP